MHVSPKLMPLSRTKVIHPPQKVWSIPRLAYGTEFTVQHSPLEFRSVTSVLSLGRCAEEKRCGILYNVTRIQYYTPTRSVCQADEILHTILKDKKGTTHQSTWTTNIAVFKYFNKIWKRGSKWLCYLFLIFLPFSLHGGWLWGIEQFHHEFK